MQQNPITNMPLQGAWKWRSKYRYYTAHLQKNLFGEWTVTKSWGGLRNKLGRQEQVTFSSLNKAINYVNNLGLSRSKRGYIDLGF